MLKKSLYYFILGGMFVGADALAAGYTCDADKIYSSCNEKYFLTASEDSREYNPTPVAGNACQPCLNVKVPSNDITQPIYCVGSDNPPLYALYFNVGAGVDDATVESRVLYVYQNKNEMDGPGVFCDAAAVGNNYGRCFGDPGVMGVLDAQVSIPVSNIPTRENYRFDGYYDGTYRTQVINEEGVIKDPSEISLTSSTTLFARWSATSCEAGKFISGRFCGDCPEGALCAGGTYKPAYLVTLNGDAQNNKFYVGEDANGNSVLCEYTEDPSVLESCLSSGTGAISKFDSSYMPSAREHYEFLGYTNVEGGMETDVVINPDGTFSVGYAGEPMTYYELWRLTSCDPNQYMDGNTCTPCPEFYPLSDGKGDVNSCYVKTNPGEYIADANTAPTKCVKGHYCPGDIMVYYGGTGGATLCPAGYQDSPGNKNATTIEACKMSIKKGFYLKNANDAQSVQCESGYYSDSIKIVAYGETSVCTKCPDLNGVSAGSVSPFDSVTTCYIGTGKHVTDSYGTFTFSTDCSYTE